MSQLCSAISQDGEIVERGTRERLLDEDGVYASMWNQQQQSLEVGEASGSGTEGDIHVLGESKM